MEERRVADYFVVAGLPDQPQPLEEFSNEAAMKPTYKQDPLTDIAIINKSLGEKVPRGYTCVTRTPGDYPADLNHGSIRGAEMFICYRRSRDKPPLTDIGVLYEGKERLMSGCEVVHTTYFGSPASVNNSNNSRIYITYRRASENAASDMLAVVDLCVILENKGEAPPHSYCQINKNLNKGLVGSDVFLCYKKAMTKPDVLAYKPAILDRYPQADYESFPLPDPVAMFCLPMGATIECWSAKAQHPLPIFSTFVLTGLHGDKVYGAAVTFYEEFPEDKLTDHQMRHLGLKNKHIREQYRIMKTVHYNKSICLLSHWPFFDAFKKLLIYLYRISITSPHTVPLERHISHFMYDVPYPSPQRPRILVQLSHDSLSLSMPEDSPLPQSGASFITLLKNLGPENCMTILLYVLHEHKILIHSLRPAVLTSVAEAVSTLIFPLQWQCPYIPLCPLGLSDVLNAPTPYIIGLDSRYFDLFEPPADVICIDLDTIRIWPPDDKKNLSYKLLPKKPTKVLQETLHTLYDRLSTEVPHSHEIALEMAPIDIDFKRKHREMLLELTIQETFLRFMACLMKGYKQYLKPIVNQPNIDTTNASSLFDMTAFIKSRDKANHKFFQQMMRTQLFCRFIEERSFVSARDTGLAFFDECTEKVDETRDDPKLIEVDGTQNSERTMFILPPEPTGLPEGLTYSYNGFPELKPELFLQKQVSTLSLPGKPAPCPSSPVARRTKQEVKTAQKLAQQYLSSPMLWAKCLLGHCYSLWFMILPAYIKHSRGFQKPLSTAYDVLKDMQRAKLKPPDELCYRVLLQLCGQYSQPVLAVKVYSEMKKAGVQPNAITYGYYNKAVLEGKWPSTISKGALLWRKVRNVIIGVAKFRKAIRRRSLSVYSNSGSEFDQISRTSIDSFLEDPGSEVKQESIIRTEPANGLVNGSHSGKSRADEPPVSDRGYSSMTQEEAKNFSDMISDKTDDQADAKNKKDGKIAPRFGFHRKHRKKEKDLLEEPANGGEDESVFKGTDSGTLEQFRARVGSIVRRSMGSLGSSGSHETLKGSLIGSTSAGLLMVSDSLDHTGLPRSMGPVGKSIEEKEKHRKRHKSAGDHHQLMPRSNSLLTGWKLRHTSAEDHAAAAIKFSDLIGKEGEADVVEARQHTIQEAIISDMQDISEEIKDSGVALDDTDGTAGNDCVYGPNGETEFSEQSNAYVDTYSDNSKPCTSDPCVDYTCGSSIEVEPTGGDISTTMESVGESIAGVLQVTNTPDEGQSNFVKSNSSSPQHSIPMVVTADDPLGLFIDHSATVTETSKQTSATIAKTSPLKVRRDDFISTTPFSNCSDSNSRTHDSGECNNPKHSSGTHEVQGSCTEVQSSLSEVQTPVTPMENIQKNLFRIERTTSFPDHLATAVKDKSFVPARSSSVQKETGALIHSNSSLNEASKSDLQSSNEFSRLFRAGSFRRHKQNFSGMLKYATGAMATKLTEIKQSMTPSKMGSDLSLTQSVDDADSTADDGSYPHTPHKFGSLDFLRKSSDTLDRTSLNGVAGAHGSAPVQPESFLDQMERQGAEEDSRGERGRLPSEIGDVAVDVEMSSCSRCGRCHCLLYDEEIMAGWNADDSNLNTVCPFCGTKLVPHLMVYLKDHRYKKKSRLPDDVDALLNFDTQTSPKSESSYGKDTMLCSSVSGDGQFLFGEDQLDGETHSVRSVDSTHDPWTRQTSQPSESTDPVPEQPTGDSPTMSDMAMAVRHRRTGSECLTSATCMVYSSSVESFDSYVHNAVRSPLSISIEEQEVLSSQPAHTPEKQTNFQRTSPMEPISVPYLSPLVLRKNLENIIDHEGNLTLAVDKFLDEHPIIFWNLVWYFKRIMVTSHLPNFLLTTYNTDLEAGEVPDGGSSRVQVRPLWDNVRLHEEAGLPMHLAWNKGQSSTVVDALVTEAQPFNRAVMYQIINHIQCNDVLSPIKLVMNGRRRFRRRHNRFRSMYREVLYLAFTALTRENIDHDAFDREYKLAFTRLSGGEIKRLQRDDKPRSQQVMCCRRVFCDLEIG